MYYDVDMNHFLTGSSNEPSEVATDGEGSVVNPNAAGSIIIEQ